MPGTPFDYSIFTRGDHTIIEMRGDVNRDAEAGLIEAWDEAESGPGWLMLNFTHTDFINSTGIALIVGLLAKAAAVDRPVGAYGLTDHYQEIFRITRLSDFMTIYEDESAAL